MFLSLLGALASIPLSNSLFEIFSSLYIALGLVLITAERRWGVFRRALPALALVFLVFCVASIAVSEFPYNSARGAFRVARCVAMCLFTMVAVDSQKKFKLAFGVTGVVLFFCALDAIAQAGLGRDLLWSRPLTPYFDKTGRVTGPFHHANDLSAYLSLAIFTFIGMFSFVWKKEDAKAKAFWVAGVLVSGLALLWTYSRGAWLAVAVSWAAMLVLKRDRRLIGWTLVVVAAALLFSPPSVRGRLASLRDLKDGTITERRILWDESIRMWQDKPWLGHGVNTYSKVGQRYKDPAIKTDFQYAHNGYLHMAAETGVLGLGSFLAFLAGFFYSNRRFAGPREDFLGAAASSLLFGIFAFLLHSATDTNLQSLRLVGFFWLASGLVMAARQIGRQAP